MKKIEPAMTQYRRNKHGHVSRWIACPDDELVAEWNGYEVRQLWTDDALQSVAEAVLIKLQEQISKRQILNDETAIDRAYNRGLDTADSIVGDFDVAAIINQLKGK